MRKNESMRFETTGSCGGTLLTNPCFFKASKDGRQVQEPVFGELMVDSQLRSYLPYFPTFCDGRVVGQAGVPKMGMVHTESDEKCWSAGS